MIKFVHKKHINQDPKTAKIVIYYSVFDIILGLTLMVLTAFFIYNYLEFKVFYRSPSSGCNSVFGAPRQDKFPVSKQ